MKILYEIRLLCQQILANQEREKENFRQAVRSCTGSNVICLEDLTEEQRNKLNEFFINVIDH